MILADHHRRTVGTAHKVDVHHIPAQGIACANGKGCRQQKARHSHPQPYLPEMCQPAQSHQQQTNKGCIVCVKIQPRPRLGADPHGPAIQQTGQGFRSLAQQQIQRPGHRDKPRKSGAKAQQKHGLHQPENRHAGQHCINADAEAPQHQNRKGSRRSTDPDAHRLGQAAADMSQDALQYSGLFLPGRVRCKERMQVTGKLRTGQCTQHSGKRQFKADITHGIAVASGHQDARRRQ